jgi:N-acetylglucosaminyldiphosphoundecaprenol N-acetyl-beta-D-mannosaminyltransferase
MTTGKLINSSMLRQEVIGFSISIGKYGEFISQITEKARNGGSEYVCVANVHMFIEAHHDASFSSIVKDAFLVTPDGKPLTWALRILHHIRQERVAGMDILPDLLERSNTETIPVFFYGGKASLLEKAGGFLKERYPGLRIAGMYSPPFKTLSDAEENEVAKMINNSGAKLVFVVLGCPKQEKWMAQMKGKINAVMVGIGGALPVLVDLQKRAPRWMQKAGLEWLYRLGQEPKRLWRRYLSTNPVFIYLLFKERIRLWIRPNK